MDNDLEDLRDSLRSLKALLIASWVTCALALVLSLGLAAFATYRIPYLQAQYENLKVEWNKLAYAYTQHEARILKLEDPE